MKHLNLLLAKLLAHQLIKNIGWMTSAQVICKVFRLAVTVVIARLLAPDEFGLIAIVFTTYEIVNAIIRRGTQVSIVNGAQEQLDLICVKAYRLNWLYAIFATSVQVIIAFVLVELYQKPELLAPILFLTINHILLPIAMVQAARNIRKQYMSLLAKIDVSQALVEASLTIILALNGFGIWSLVIPKVLVTPIWIVNHLRQSNWRYTVSTKTSNTIALQCNMLKESVKMVGIDMTGVLRNHIDYLLVGYFLGVEALGIYYFAYNAGVGISNSVLQASSSALLPYLSKFNRNNNQLKNQIWFSMKVLMSMTLLIVITQTSLASFYVPIVFGEKWVSFGALPILIILCLSAIPRALLELTSQSLRAKGQTGFDLKGNVMITSLMIAALFIGIPYGLIGVAYAVTISLLIGAVIFSWVAHHKFSEQLAPRAAALQ
jgi:teichuronic acid exporter